MNSRMKRGLAAGLLTVALALLAWFASNMPFYTWADPLERASLMTVRDGEALAFSYADDAITLQGGEGAAVYALTGTGLVELANGEADRLPGDCLGTLAAVKPAYKSDTDGDGTVETVVETARTDMAFTYDYEHTAHAISDDRVPFEVLYPRRGQFVFTMNGEPLVGAEITAVLADGSEVALTTDVGGASTALSINDVRGGVTFVYRPDDTRTFRLHYQIEDNTVFSLRWMRAMTPFTLILLIALVLIVLDVLARRAIYRKRGLSEARARIFQPSAVRRRPCFGFEPVRWGVMLLSFAGLIWGGRLVGTAFSKVDLPVLACPYNLDQATSAGCYWFSHITELLERPPSYLLWFVGSFAAFALLFGRMLCGFVCPLGFLQDVAHEARMALRIEGIALNERLYAVLRFVKWVMLALFLGIGLIGGSFCDLCPAAALTPALAGFKTSLYFSGFMMIAVIVSGFFKRRCFCNICPMGYLLGLPHRASLARLRKDAVACTECGACYEACPMGIKSIFTVREGKNERAVDVTTADCIFCGECIRKCPEDGALYMTLAGVKLYNASRMAFLREQAGVRKKRESHG
jgi:ferredoxin